MGKSKGKTFEITYGKNKVVFLVDKLLFVNYIEKENASVTIITFINGHNFEVKSDPDDNVALETYNKLKELMK